MKRVLLFCFILIFVFNVSDSFCESKVRYTAVSSVGFHLRRVPNGRKTVRVPEGEKIQILELNEEWCLARYRGKTGYCKKTWIYSLMSLDPALYPLPQIPCAPEGYIVMSGNMRIQAGDFDGTTVSAGEKICALYTDDMLIKLPVWRTEQVVDINPAEYHPFVAWKDAEPGDIIGGFTTYYSKSQGKRRPKEREKNIYIGCKRINSAIVAVGENFSFNDYCDPYTRSNGYFLAPNISLEGNGYGYGGGVCQVSTTLYNAVLTLPLKIEAWSVHRYTGVSYVPQFYDAAVGRYSDFIFTNTLPYPIRIEARAGNGVINIFILRAEE